MQHVNELSLSLTLAVLFLQTVDEVRSQREPADQEWGHTVPPSGVPRLLPDRPATGGGGCLPQGGQQQM